MKLSLNFRRKKKDENVEEPAEQSAEKPSKKEKKPSGGGIKRWLFLHGEKVATLTVVAVLGLMVYSAIGKLELKRGQTPDDLKNRASQIRDKIDSSRFPAARFPVPDYTGYVSRSSEKLAPESYDIGPVTGDEEGPCSRCDPKIFPAQELQAKAGHGIFFVTRRQTDLQGVVVSGGAPEVSKTEGRRWVVIQALVPYQQQIDAYISCFMRCLGYDPARDWPQFAHVNVRRIEIVPGAQEDWNSAKEWAVDPSYLKRVQSAWSGRGTDPVPRKFHAAGLTQALGPLAYNSWKGWASHSKLAEFVSEAQADAERQAAPQAAAGPGVGAFGGQRRPPGFPAGRGAPAATQPPTEEADPHKRPPLTEFKLVRIFDFDVEPGKSYRYQLQVVMKNPNSKSRGLPAFYLDNPATMEEAVRQSDWSAPGGVARVPHDATIFAAGIEAPTEERPEPAAQVVVKILEVTKGTQPAGKLTLQRGEPLQGVTRMYYAGAKSQPLVIDKSAKVDTDYTLIDLRQSRKLGLGADSPAEMLFMDNRGNLIFRNTADDTPQVDRFQKTVKAATRQEAQQPTPQLPPKREPTLQELQKRKRDRR